MMSGFTPLSADEAEAAAAPETVEVHLQLAATNSTVLGRYLDLVEHAAAQSGVDCEIDAPGYHQAFYGWEKVQR